MSDDKKYSSIHYDKYLELQKLLGAQIPRSAQFEDKAAHEEMLFIVVHQVYELWFKQMLHELESVLEMFNTRTVDEKNLGIALIRLDRVSEIFKLIIQQIDVLETMTPLDFLDFRNYLFPASGFQSFQFRKLEVVLGLQNKKRLTYHGQHYASVFTEEQQAELKDSESKGSLFDAIEQWLERTPFLDFGQFNFLQHYRESVNRMIEKERSNIQASEYLLPKIKEMRLKMLGTTDTFFESVLNKEAHQKMKEEGSLRLSYRATLSALFVNLYRDEPILHNPYRLLDNLMEIDSLFTSWRDRHAQMVLKMIGRKIGTGGSSGHEYLKETAKKHHIFSDLHNISTLLIPRSELAPLPDDLRRELGFVFSQNP